MPPSAHHYTGSWDYITPIKQAFLLDAHHETKYSLGGEQMKLNQRMLFLYNGDTVTYS